MRNLVFILLLIPICLGYSQPKTDTVDSLKTVLDHEITQIERINTLDELATAYMKLNLDSSVLYLEYAGEIAQKIKNDTLLANIYNELGGVYVHIGITDKAMDYIQSAVKIYESEQGFQNKIISAYNNLGVIHFRSRDLDKAMEYYQLAENVATTYKDQIGKKYPYIIGSLLNNMGVIHENEGRYDEALEVYFRAITLSKEFGDSTNLGNIYSNIGLVYQKTGQFDLAYSNLREAMYIRKEQGDDFRLSRSYRHLGHFFWESKRSLDSARYYLVKSIELAEAVGSHETIILGADALSKVYSSLNMPAKAYETLQLHDYWEDSLNSVETQKMITELELKHEYEERQRDRMLEQERSEKRNLIIGSVLMVISVVSILLYFLQRIKSKNSHLQKMGLELSNRNLKLEKHTLEQELEFKNKELTTNVMYLMKKNELLSDVSQRLLELKKNVKKENTTPVQRIIYDLNTAKDNDTWEEFELRFQQVHNNFYNTLLQRFPDLSTNDKKLCAFLRLDLSSKEICTMTGQTLNSLNVARARLRKKLGLDTSDNLTSFLSQL